MTGPLPHLFYIVDWLPPDFGAVGQYGLMFAREMAEAGRDVHLVGLTSRHSDIAAEQFSGRGSLEVIRIRTAPYKKSRNLERLLWTIRTNYQLIRTVVRHPNSRNSDVLFTGAPPFMLFFAMALKVLRKVSLIYRITDFYPEVIIAERGKRNLGLNVLQFWTWFLRRRVDAYEALGEDQRRILIKAGISPERISVKRDRSPIVTSDYQRAGVPPALKDRKLLLYSGNYGLAHDVDTVVEGLKRHHRLGSARFGLWLNASGRNADRVVGELTAAKVPFAHTSPVSLDVLGSLLAAADVHLITLRPSFSGIVLPSKIYACLASRRPILFVGPESSDVHLLCTQASGLPYQRIEPGDPIGFAQALDRFAMTDSIRMPMQLR